MQVGLDLDILAGIITGGRGGLECGVVSQTTRTLVGECEGEVDIHLAD